MQAIVTRYHGSTDKRGSRVSARCQARSISTVWLAELNSEQNHRHAAIKLANKLNWPYERLVSGVLPDGKTHVHLFAECDRASRRNCQDAYRDRRAEESAEEP